MTVTEMKRTLLEKFVEACRLEAALALNVNEDRVTAFGREEDDGTFTISWKLDGRDPTGEQVALVDQYIRAVIAMATTVPD